MLALLASIVTTGALLKCLLEAHAGRRNGWRASVSFALSHIPSLLLLGILTGLGLALSAILLIIPAIYLYVCWCVAIPVLMLEGIKGPKALGRSRRLIKGRWWATFSVLLATFVILTVFYVVLLLLQHAAIGSMNSITPILVTRGIFLVLFRVITYPVLAAVTAMIYVDLRTRKEAFDLELFGDWLSSEPASGAAPAAVAAGTPSFGSTLPPGGG